MQICIGKWNRWGGGGGEGEAFLQAIENNPSISQQKFCTTHNTGIYRNLSSKANQYSAVTAAAAAVAVAAVFVPVATATDATATVAVADVDADTNAITDGSFLLVLLLLLLPI